MKNVIKNGLRQDLEFRGALHLSLKDKVVSGYDKIVINVNKSYQHGIWADFIVIPSFGGDNVEIFRIGGRVVKSLTGHRDLSRWIDYCIQELDWKVVISSSNKDALIVDIFNFINGASDVILTSDTEFNLKDGDGLGVETFYPYYPEDNDDSDDEIEEEIVEEEVVEEEEYTGYQKPVAPEEVVQFLDYKLTRIEDGGLGCKSPNFIFSYENEKVYSKLDLFIEKDDEGNPHITKADIYKCGFGGSRDKVKSISTAEDLEDFKTRGEEFTDRIIKAPNLGSVTKEAFYRERLEKDLLTLIKSLLFGMEWKESLTSEPTEDDEY